MKNNYEDIEQICAMCENSEKIFDPDNVLCKINGVVSAAHCCRKFVYDPLKRIPSKTAKLAPFDFVDIDSDDDENLE